MDPEQEKGQNSHENIENTEQPQGGSGLLGKLMGGTMAGKKKEDEFSDIRGMNEHMQVERKFKRMKFVEGHAYGFGRFLLVMGGILFFVVVFALGYVLIRAILPPIDTDNDGVPDIEDLCQGFDDRIDEDLDGIPDDCDDAVPPIDFESISFSNENLIEIDERMYDVVFDVSSNHPEWGVNDLLVRVSLLDAAGEILKSETATTYIEPDSSRTVIVPRISTSEQASSANIEILDGEFLRLLAGESIPLEVREKQFTPQGSDGLARFTGLLENDSNFDLDEVEVQVFVKNQQGSIVSANFTKVNTLQTDETRFFELRWNEGFSANVTFDVKITTNAMDPENLIRQRSGEIEI